MSTSISCPVGIDDCKYLIELSNTQNIVNQLAKQLRTDTLTGLYNYRFFLESLESELERTRRTNQPTGLIMLDIDFFKKVNDTWGHENGNRALVHLSAIIMKGIRKVDIGCRYGGEEFGVILPGTGLPQTVNVAERLRSMVENSQVELDGGHKLKMTISLGVENYTAIPQLTPEQFVHKADEYLYQSKKHGRNKVSHPAFTHIDTQVSKAERAALFSDNDL